MSIELHKDRYNYIPYWNWTQSVNSKDFGDCCTAKVVKAVAVALTALVETFLKNGFVLLLNGGIFIINKLCPAQGRPPSSPPISSPSTSTASHTGKIATNSNPLPSYPQDPNSFAAVQVGSRRHNSADTPLSFFALGLNNPIHAQSPFSRSQTPPESSQSDPQTPPPKSP